MKKLLKSSFFGLYPSSIENYSQYIRDNLEFMKNAGFDAAGISLRVLATKPSTEWQPIIEQALQDAAELDIPIIDCHLPFFGEKLNQDPAFAEICVKRIYAGIDMAKVLGVKHSVLHPNAYTVAVRNFDEQKTYDQVMAHLSPIAEYAAKLGVGIAIENTRVVPGILQSRRYCQGPEELCKVADALGFSVCWDFGHANIAGCKQSEALAYIGKRLKTVHVNDNNGANDDHTAPFMGTVDWVDAMHGLALAEFKGPLNYEITTSRVPETLRKDYAKFLIAAADQLMEYIV